MTAKKHPSDKPYRRTKAARHDACDLPAETAVPDSTNREPHVAELSKEDFTAGLQRIFESLPGDTIARQVSRKITMEAFAEEHGRDSKAVSLDLVADNLITSLAADYFDEVRKCCPTMDGQDALELRKSRFEEIAFHGIPQEFIGDTLSCDTLPAEPEPVSEPVGPLEYCHLPLGLMRAALACVSTEETRSYLNGIFVHAIDNMTRMVSTDGHRMFIGSATSDPATRPTWLQDGVIISRDRLPKIFAMLAGDANLNVKIGFADRSPKVELSDLFGDTVFRVNPVDGTFPDYQRVIPPESLAGGETVPLDGKNFNADYLKAASALAKVLGAEHVRLHAGASSETPTIITYPDIDGAVLVLMPTRPTSVHLSPRNAEILAPAIKGSVAALRAHRTRCEMAIHHCTANEAEELRAKMADYDARIAGLLAGNAPAKIAGPAEPAFLEPAGPAEPDYEEDNVTSLADHRVPETIH